MRVRKDEERSTENLSIRMKPSVKSKLKDLADWNDVKLAEMIEMLILKEHPVLKKEYIGIHEVIKKLKV
jgi:hypothetical protein